MRLLYVAMTLGREKLYLVGKGSKEKLTQQFGTDVENNRLPVALRDQIATYQDWVMALDTAFMSERTSLTACWGWGVDTRGYWSGSSQGGSDATTYLTTARRKTLRALTVLESVEKLNQLYTPGSDWSTICAYAEPAQSLLRTCYDTEGGYQGQERVAATSWDYHHLWAPDFGQKLRSLELQLVQPPMNSCNAWFFLDKVTLQDGQASSRVSADDQLRPEARTKTT